MKKEVLRMQDICYSENEADIVRDSSFHVFRGETVGLVGKNHVGKSALMGAATGEFPCQAGDIWIDEQPRRIESIEQARKEGILLIKSESSLIDIFTIKDTMKLNYAFTGEKQGYGQYMKKCQQLLIGFQLAVPLHTQIYQMNFHQRVLLEIFQALV